MKKYQVLLSSLLVLGIVDCMLAPNADAYEVSIRSSGGVSAGPNLEDYEATVLDKIAEQVKGAQIPKNSRIRVVVNESGKFSEVTFLAPRPEKSVKDELVNKISALALSPPPGLSGTVQFTLEFNASELGGPYNRNGISISSGRGVTMSGGVIVAPGSDRSAASSSEKGAAPLPELQQSKIRNQSIDIQQRMRNSMERHREISEDRRGNRELLWNLRNKIKDCTEALQGTDRKLLKSSLEDLANDIDALPYLTNGISLTSDVERLILEVARTPGIANLEPQISKVGASLERKTKLGILSSFFDLNEKSKTKFAIELSDRFYSIKLARLKEFFQINEDWLADMTDIAEQKGKFDDAIDCQKKMLALSKDPNAVGITNLILARLEIARGNNAEAKVACEKAIKLLSGSKQQGSTDDRLTSSLAELATKFATSDVALADKLARQSVDSLLSQAQPEPHDAGRARGFIANQSRSRDTEIKTAITALLEQYKTTKNYPAGVSLLEYTVNKMRPARGDDNEVVNDLRCRLADFTLYASSHDAKQKTKWLAQSDAAFQIVLKVEKQRDVNQYKRLIRARVEQFDKLGYEQEAKSLEKLLEL